MQPLKDRMIGKAEDVRDYISERTGLYVIRERLPHPAAPDVTTLYVPGYRQMNAFSCAAAAGLMILRTFRPKASIARFYRLVNPNPDTGAGIQALVRALRKSGIGVGERKQLQWRDIRAAIRDGFPIITLVKTSDPDVAHWIVIYGVGIKPNRVFLAGSGMYLLGRYSHSWQQFRSLWDPKGFGLVCWGK